MNETLEDILTKDLAVIFCGINPGLKAAATGHHFMGRSNRFWRTLHLAGFTPHEVQPENDRSILQYQCGLTTLVERPTARADQLSADEFRAAATSFERKIARYAPRYVAFLGKAAYSALSGQKQIAWGLQPHPLGRAAVWVLPNPSGRNLGFTQVQLVEAYRRLKLALDAPA
ncbi:G:T/U mismatch-specific uracil/thymine DNA-glycosylase [Pseudomonas yamanorum]|jgi:TDG/mug DNA glycosylase family protein|uniref:G/U mismatch-specific DNA glycosylase n=1 Tax=Pseudomonas yamanorum TaxID=515393 RepID=UPI0007A397E0|nr:G/U mismatch-specific DNA glycosylase [Pseudomonas yamanorum]AMW84781.1 G:T/U mismatch-specific uracil/thymine DNA-glycosylase [Pseudomonas yamanorum]